MTIPTTFQVAEISDIWSKFTIYPKCQLWFYGLFGYMVNFNWSPRGPYIRDALYFLVAVALTIMTGIAENKKALHAPYPYFFSPALRQDGVKI